MTNPMAKPQNEIKIYNINLTAKIPLISKYNISCRSKLEQQDIYNRCQVLEKNYLWQFDQIGGRNTTV